MSETYGSVGARYATYGDVPGVTYGGGGRPRPHWHAVDTAVARATVVEGAATATATDAHSSGTAREVK